MAQGNTATSVGRTTGTQSILLWLDRNDASQNHTVQSPADAWRNYLQRQVGSAGTDGKRDLERLWLGQRIATLGGATTGGSGLSSLWTTYLNLKGYSGGIDDMFRTWIDSGTA